MSWMSQVVFSMCWNSEEVSSNSSKGIDFTSESNSKQVRNNYFFHVRYVVCCLAEGVVQVKDRSSHLKRSVLKVGLPN